MALLGRQNQLTVVREAPPGMFLDGGRLGEILMPRKYVPAGTVPGDVVWAFVYRDSEDRPVATTETPLAMVGDFAVLRVLSTRPSIGAFLDWGLAKDLLLPRREQSGGVREGDLVAVRIAIDEKSDRIIASARINRWLNETRPSYHSEQPVRLLVTGETPLGYNAVVENAHWGLLYHSELAAPLQMGDVLNGYVRTVRPDGKIDLSLDRAGFGRIKPLTGQILEALEKAGGRLPFHDKSSPEEIRAAFGVSKKAFKQALGALYRKKQILLTDAGIERIGKR